MTKHDSVSLGGIMKATEFVKNHGLSEAISKVEDCEFLRAESFNWLGHEVNCEELKRLVESYELLKIIDLESPLIDELVNELIETDRPRLVELGKRIKQAIADVEACQ